MSKYSEHGSQSLAKALLVLSPNFAVGTGWHPSDGGEWGRSSMTVITAIWVFSRTQPFQDWPFPHPPTWLTGCMASSSRCAELQMKFLFICTSPTGKYTQSVPVEQAPQRIMSHPCPLSWSMRYITCNWGQGVESLKLATVPVIQYMSRFSQ